MKKIFLVLFLFIIIGCSNTNEIDDDFKVSYVDMQVNRNIYYQNQGIFDDLSVNEVVFDDDKILVKGYLFRNSSEVDSSKCCYYIIDKITYAADPSQMKSIGLTGPVDSLQFENAKVRLAHPKILSW